MSKYMILTGLRAVSNWARILVLFLVLVFSTSAYSETDRVDLIRLAHEGLNYFLTSSVFNKAFTQSLSPQQKIIAIEISSILEEASALRFYQTHEIKPFVRPNGENVYGYVDQNEKVQTFKTFNTKAAGLVLSYDREEFKNLKPGEPERYLKTTPDFSGAIKINVKKLNEDPSLIFDLGRAVSILIHEYGHKARAVLERKSGKKLEDSEIQPVIDQLGEDLASYLRGKINKFPLRNGVTVYSLAALDFDHKKWSEAGFKQPENPYGVWSNQSEFVWQDPKRAPIDVTREILGPLNILANQGLYVWTEFQGEIKNISDQIRKQILKNNLPKNTLTNNFYHFVNHEILVPTSVKVIELSTGEINIDLLTAQISVQLPYMIPGISPDPKEASFNKVFRWSEAGYAVVPVTTQLDARVNGSVIVFRPPRLNPRQISPFPLLSAKLGEMKLEGHDFIFRIEVPDNDAELTKLAFFRNLPLQGSEIKIKSQRGQTFYLTSEGKDDSKVESERTIIYVFRLKNASSIIDDYFEIEALYLKTINDLTSKDSEIRLEIPLYENIKVTIPQNEARIDVTKASPHQISIKDVKTEHKTIKILVETSEPIQNITMTLEVQDNIFSLETLEGSGEKLFYKLTESIINDRALILNLNSNQFTAKVLDSNIIELSFNIFDLVSDTSNEVLKSQNIRNGPKNEKSLAKTLNSEIKVHNVSILSDSLQSASFNEVRILNSDGHGEANNSLLFSMIKELSLKPKQARYLIPISCQGLFNK